MYPARRSLLLVASALLTAFALTAVASASDNTSTLRLTPGGNVVTWSGTEPYAIANFEGTPVTKIHRFDAVRQRWLSHVIGQDYATLPELHLLPRVQYLMISDETHELTIPNPIAGIDPLARLRFPPTPDDPLRFEAYWPNEDSPLEDLVVLRGEERRLSVKAWVAGGAGDVSVWWAIDGRVNHVGLESDDVDLTPGAHDHGRLYAVSDADQVAVVELPRVVRLASYESLDLPEMQFGVVTGIHLVSAGWDPVQLSDPDFCADWQSICVYIGNFDAVLATIELIADAGFSIVRTGGLWEETETQLKLREQWMEHFVSRGIDMVSLEYFFPKWVSASDLSLDYYDYSGSDKIDRALGGPAVDVRHFGDYLGTFAGRYPQIRYWQLHNEPDLSVSFQVPDPVSLVEHSRAGALAAWHANPDAVILGPGFSSVLFDIFEDYGSRNSIELLDEMLEYGLGDYVDAYDYHYYDGCSHPDHQRTPWNMAQMKRDLDAYRSVMAKHGEGGKQLWMTEIGVHGPSKLNNQEEADCIVETLAYLDQRPDVNAAFVHGFLQASDELRIGSSGLVMAPFENGTFTIKPAYWAVKEYIANRP